ncbi:hypothetical protein BC829DRAFT_415268 [Chytridium lagenaria]|nr:hypothetical protein BC829DRAFT_415268 [Chytridium lagenaria]
MSRTGVSVAPTSTSSTSPNLHTWHAMHHLSPELLHAVFSYLPYFDLATCERICQTWRSLIVASPHLWMRQAISCLPPHRKARPTLLCGEMDNKDFPPSPHTLPQHSPPKPISALPDFPLVANRGRLPPLPTSQTRTIISAISHRMNIFIAETNTTLWVSQERDDGLRYGVLDLTAPVMRVNWCHSHRDIVSGRFLMLSNVDGSMGWRRLWIIECWGWRFLIRLGVEGTKGLRLRGGCHTKIDTVAFIVTGLLTRTMEYYALPKASTLANASKAQRTPKALWSIGINANETGVSMNDDVVAVVRFGG